MKTLKPITEVNGFDITKNGEPQWFESMAINSDEEEIAALHESWGTADKFRGEECPRCRGRGQLRKDKNVGCIKCQGLGVLSA